jgi:hypothetical protein
VPNKFEYTAEITIPEDFEGEEVYLIWDCGCEAMIWENGEPQQGNQK